VTCRKPVSDAVARAKLSHPGETMTGMIGKLHGVVIDCPDPSALATFYQELLCMVRLDDEDDWVAIGDSPERPGLAFQRVAEFHAPEWPDPRSPQQFHLDVRVDDIDAAERRVLALGARRLPGEGQDFRVFADPVGHPFCLCR
jgi:catechol 2,3-dioxygenase-like lactoylglutathione lyase family enzyme